MVQVAVAELVNEGEVKFLKTKTPLIGFNGKDVKSVRIQQKEVEPDNWLNFVEVTFEFEGSSEVRNYCVPEEFNIDYDTKIKLSVDRGLLEVKIPVIEANTQDAEFEVEEK